MSRILGIGDGSEKPDPPLRWPAVRVSSRAAVIAPSIIARSGVRAEVRRCPGGPRLLATPNRPSASGLLLRHHQVKTKEPKRHITSTARVAGRFRAPAALGVNSEVAAPG